MSEPARKALESLTKKSGDVGEAIAAAASHDLVFAVVGHAGSGASRVAQALLEGLKSKGYDAHLVKISALIKAAVQQLDPPRWSVLNTDNRLKAIDAFQDAGNWLRKEYGATFTAALAIRTMHDARQRGIDSKVPMAFVLDSLKNPSEVDALRQVYGRSFYLVSVVCGPNVRTTRLRTKLKDVPKEDLPALMQRDEGEEEKTGQQVAKTIHIADFFINNHAERPSSGTDPVDEALSRFLQIVSGTEVVRATRDERGMFAAWGASLRSSCLSRQVGAAILDPEGSVLSTGTNDVPRAGGGLYEEPDDTLPHGDHNSRPSDYRCFNHAEPDAGEPTGFCRSDKTKLEILNEVVKKLDQNGFIKDGIDQSIVIESLKKTPLGDLIEFSRAVHAEMDAIVTLARTSSATSQGATLYTTTYPCHSCARHIVAAGIDEVIYYEPYLKSRALELHSDSIEEGVGRAKERGKVRFRLFSGVAPRRYASLFEKKGELKKDGRLYLPQSEAVHHDPIFTKSYLDFERNIAAHVKKTTANSDATSSDENPRIG